MVTTMRETVLHEALVLYLTELDDNRAQFGTEDVEIEERYTEAKAQYLAVAGHDWVGLEKFLERNKKLNG